MRRYFGLVVFCTVFVFGIMGFEKFGISAFQDSASNRGAETHKPGERMVKTVDGVEYAFRWCPAGKFVMGSPKDEENRETNETQYEVTLTKGFWMLETEVTQEMWQSVMGTSLEEQAQKMLDDKHDLRIVPDNKITLRDFHAILLDKDPSTLKVKDVVFGEGPDYPMYHVNWNECQEFCEKLSRKIGMEISMPTEAQWEYACRAGTTGAHAGDLDEMSWYNGEFGFGSSHPVGQKKPNAWGLYDMHGNVCEFCQGWYAPYPNGSVTDPTGPEDGIFRVNRGGSWLSIPMYCRSAFRAWFVDFLRCHSVGFRLVAKGEASAPGTGRRNEKIEAEEETDSGESQRIEQAIQRQKETAPDGETRLVKVVDGVEYAFRWCPPGKFMMGSPKNEKGHSDPEETQHEVILTKGFWMMETEVTQEMWQSVMGESIEDRAPKGTINNELRGEGPSFPMYYVGWYDCQDFCEKLSEKIGMKISLPTEAQWEYACRAGTRDAYAGDLDSMAWYGGNSDGTAHEVAQKKPNPWGLYDMHGNVGEWCQDWYGPYSSERVTDPTGPEEVSFRVFRGGCWINSGVNDGVLFCRSAYRVANSANYSDIKVGFRPVGMIESETIKSAKEDGAKENQIQPERQKPISQAVQLQKNTAPEGITRLVKTVDGVEYAFRWCPAGTFTMGSPEKQWKGLQEMVQKAGIDYSENQHEVTLTKGFWMLETEVTQEMWQSVMGNNPSKFKGSDLPVEKVSWEDCQEFCWKLSAKTGLKISLPTEAQWEYACRAGSKTSFFWGNVLNGDKANCNGKRPHGTSRFGKFLGKTAPVRSYEPNAWGLYDMHGNVTEWCQDWYEEVYPNKHVVDPEGPGTGIQCVVRGGSWVDIAAACRSSYRLGISPIFSLENLGFRLVLEEDAEEPEPAESQGPGETASDDDDIEIDDDEDLEIDDEDDMEIDDEESEIDWETGDYEAGKRMVKTVDGIEYAFRWCPAGKFMMGSPKDEKGREENEHQHEVTLTQGFWMLETEVTQNMWMNVMGNNPSRKNGVSLPVESVSWEDCQEFCKKLSDKTGMTFALPTEAQWEYACRAGTTGPHAGDLDEIAWCGESGNFSSIHSVGHKKPNAWGLYDMYGNVCEWCQDWYASDYGGDSSCTDPTGPATGSSRVDRGGSWFYSPGSCRSASRSSHSPTNGVLCLGFRFVCLTDPDAIQKLDEERQQREEEEKQIQQEEKRRQQDEPERIDQAVQLQKETAPDGETRLVKTVDGVEYAFRWCPPGTFKMGNLTSEERSPGEIQTEVTLTQGFWMLETEVTQEMWKSVMGSTPSKFEGDDLPVENVSWESCQRFCEKLSKKIGMKISLPTEAQWEYACRAGTTAAYAGDLDSMGWYPANSGKKTHPVGQKEPNAWGLYDMHGNVEEWCQDWYGEYTNGSVTDPTGPAQGSGRVFRGGSWTSHRLLCRSASRDYQSPGIRISFVGFRIIGSEE